MNNKLYIICIMYSNCVYLTNLHSGPVGNNSNENKQTVIDFLKLLHRRVSDEVWFDIHFFSNTNKSDVSVTLLLSCVHT
jgi:hypothetical protein